VDLQLKAPDKSQEPVESINIIMPFRKDLDIMYFGLFTKRSIIPPG
jgi:hypothetical protein